MRSGAADANPTSGMIDGSYAAQMPAYYLQKNLRSGVRRVCVEVSGTTATLSGGFRTQDHSGTWAVRRTVTLMADSGTHVPPLKLESEYKTDDAWNTAREAWEAHYRNDDGSVKPRGGRENCGFYAADDPNRPTNWCDAQRAITPAIPGFTDRLWRGEC